MNKEEIERLEAYKRSLITEENVRRKIRLVFPDEDPEFVLAKLNECTVWPGPRLFLIILRICEDTGNAGSLSFLYDQVDHANSDPRDLLVYEYIRDFSYDVDETQLSEEESYRLQVEDAQEHINWLLK